MTDTTDPREGGGEYAELLEGLQYAASDGNNWRHASEIEEAAAAIRALEAKVRGLEADANDYNAWSERAAGQRERAYQIAEELRADRDRLSEALAVEQRLSKSWQETAEKFRQERDRLAGEVFGVRLALTNAQQVADELRAELAAARHELAKRREHMRREIKPGRATGGEG